jgi:hypothetical protein
MKLRTLALLACLAPSLALAQDVRSPLGLQSGGSGLVSGMSVAPDLSGSTARALKNRALDVGVSVLDFGASGYVVGSGGDDAPAINAALQAACAYTTTNPAAKTCKVIFPEPPSGSYNVCASSINLPGYWSSVLLQGTGARPSIRIKPDCASPPQQVLFQPATTGDSSAARVHIDNLTFDAYCKAPYGFYAGYAVSMQVTNSIFRNSKAGTNSANIWINGGYENNIDKTTRAENVNEPGHTCYNTFDDLPDYNFVTRTSDSWYGLVAIDAKIANYWNANGGGNHYADAHGWGFNPAIGATTTYASSDLSAQYVFLVDGYADITNAVIDTYRTAGIYLRGDFDTNGNRTTLSRAHIVSSHFLGGAAGTHAVQLDPGLTNAVIVANMFPWTQGSTGDNIFPLSGTIDPSNVIANNSGPNTTTANVRARPVSGGDTAVLTAYAAGGGAALSTQSTAANASLYLNAKGTGSVQLNSNSALAFAAVAPVSAVNFLNATAAVTGAGPSLQAAGADANASLTLASKGTSPLVMATGNGTGLRLLDPGAAVVNYMQLQSGAVGGALQWYAAGSDTNIPIVHNTKGIGSHFFRGGDGTTALQVLTVAAAANYATITGAVAGASPVIRPGGSDTNTALTVLGKGTAGVLTGAFVRTADPTTTDIPTGQCADWNNTTAATFKHVCNFGGTLRSVAMN